MLRLHFYSKKPGKRGRRLWATDVELATMLKTLIATTVICSTALSGCSNGGGTIYRKDTFGDTQVLSLDARQRLVIQSGTGKDRVVCTEPSPDAIVAQAAQIAASGGGTFSGNSANAALAASQSEAAASIAMRTQSIQLLRDGYFRLCEAYMNHVLPKWQYQSTIAFVDEFIATVVAIEAIGGIVHAAPVTIVAGGKAVAGTDADPSAAVTGSGDAGDITAKTTNLSAEQAKAVEGIIEKYYKRKAEYLASIEQARREAGE